MIVIWKKQASLHYGARKGIPRLKEMERDLILTTLEEHGGNRSQTAETLGISIRTLRNRLREYRDQGMEVTPARSAG